MRSKNNFNPSLPYFHAAGDILTADEAKNLFLNGLDMLPMKEQEETLSAQAMRSVGNGFFVPGFGSAVSVPPEVGTPQGSLAGDRQKEAVSFPGDTVSEMPGAFGTAPAPSGNPFKKAGGLEDGAPFESGEAEYRIGGDYTQPESFGPGEGAFAPTGAFSEAAPAPFGEAHVASGNPFRTAGGLDGSAPVGTYAAGMPAGARGAYGSGVIRGAAPIKLRSSTSAALQVRIKDKTVQNGKKTILRDINFDVKTGDFVLILGGSGAGKTTLIRSILGESKANGNIVLNGSDLYKNFRTMKSQIGIVPQFLTLRLNDTVRNTVTDAAYIRLAGAFGKQDIQRRVDSVLEKAGIMPLENSLIGDLSGGQKKRVSVAVQLVGSQSVFICDEPDSGLDAAARTQLMELLAEISRSGKIVMVISHYPDDAIDYISKVVVLAKSNGDKAGHVCYDGDVAGALRTFGVPQLQEIMKELNPPHEGGKGLADEYIERWRRVSV